MAERGYRMRRDDIDGSLHKVVELDGVEGYEVEWTDSCSGCYETDEGCPLPGAQYDEKARCHLGMGREECWYTGKRRRREWVPFDIDATLQARKTDA